MIKTALVAKTPQETNQSLLRRFSRRVQGVGAVRRAKTNRYAERAKSPLKQREQALKRLARQLTYERLRKLGKIPDVVGKKTVAA